MSSGCMLCLRPYSIICQNVNTYNFSSKSIEYFKRMLYSILINKRKRGLPIFVSAYTIYSNTTNGGSKT